MSVNELFTALCTSVTVVNSNFDGRLRKVIPQLVYL